MFVIAKANRINYIGLMIRSFGSSKPEIIINPLENFDEKYKYYMTAYDDDLILDCTKTVRERKIIAAVSGNTFEELQAKLIGENSNYMNWRQKIADAIDRTYEKMIEETPPESEEEENKCKGKKEAIKGMFINNYYTIREARFIYNNIDKYEEIIDICMNGTDMEFNRKIIELQKLQNEDTLKYSADE